MFQISFKSRRFFGFIGGFVDSICKTRSALNQAREQESQYLDATFFHLSQKIDLFDSYPVSPSSWSFNNNLVANADAAINSIRLSVAGLSFILHPSSPHGGAFYAYRFCRRLEFERVENYPQL